MLRRLLLIVALAVGAVGLGARLAGHRDATPLAIWGGMIAAAVLVERWRYKDRRTEDGDGWADQVRFRIESGPIKDTYTLDYEWDVLEDGTGVVSWTLVEGEVLKAMDGSYTLESVADGTKVTYALAVDVRIPMIGAIKRTAEKKIVTGALDGLKKRVEG